jgi:hypothetical protein
VIAVLRAVQFWGFAPPDQPHGSALTAEKRALATKLRKWPAPEPWCMTV